jgi:hypothetical protein
MESDLRSHLFKRFAFILFGLFIADALANHFYWYESFFGFDKIMHFTGGIVGSLFLAWLLYQKYTYLLKKNSILKLFLINSGFFLLAAILWECLEFSVQGYFGVGHLLATPIDSVGDLFFGLMGSLVGLTYFLNKYRHFKMIHRQKYGK